MTSTSDSRDSIGVLSAPDEVIRERIHSVRELMAAMQDELEALELVLRRRAERRVSSTASSAAESRPPRSSATSGKKRSALTPAPVEPADGAPIAEPARNLSGATLGVLVWASALPNQEVRTRDVREHWALSADLTAKVLPRLVKYGCLDRTSARSYLLNSRGLATVEYARQTGKEIVVPNR
jgi:hypothetical protein